MNKRVSKSGLLNTAARSFRCVAGCIGGGGAGETVTGEDEEARGCAYGLELLADDFFGFGVEGEADHLGACSDFNAQVVAVLRPVAVSGKCGSGGVACGFESLRDGIANGFDVGGRGG